MDEDLANENPEALVEEPERVAPAPTYAIRLVYTGPAAVLVFAGVEFPFGVPVEASAEMIEQLRAHPLSAEGHALTLVE